MRRIAALLVTLLAASPSGAQSVTNDAPSIIPRAKSATIDRTSKGDVARAAIDEFAACILGRRRKPTLQALALPSGSMEQGKALGSLGAKECIASGELRFDAWTFRGSLYIALVRTQFGRKAASLGPEPVDFTKQPLPGDGSPPVADVAALLKFASCVIHQDPENARNAILATAGSPMEDAALAELAKVYGQCLYADQTLRLSKGSLKGSLAEAYYREGSAPAQSSVVASFVCTEVMGMMTTGEWYNAGFEAVLGAELDPKWQGRFAHYGYVMEYANPDSYAWSSTPLGGVNSVSLTAPCAQNANAPDRIVYQAWSWELASEEAWVKNLEAALTTIREKRPSAKRIELMTIVRCPANGWCHPDKPALGPDTDHNATKQDCHVPAYVDTAFAKVAASHPGLVTVAPKFEARACAAKIDGIHLGEQNRPVAADIGTHYKALP